tara:strand:- start:43 stop:894 length:852 start_codon:yes stop_codon:yes gene_type:complete
MAKTLRTSGDYKVQAGAGYNGGSGSNTITLDAKTVSIPGDLTVEGTNTTLDTTTLTIEDPIIRLAKNNTNTTDVDSGFLVERGITNNAAFYWNEGDSVFKAVTTTSDGTGTSITDTALANIRVAAPSNNADAATKNYVDTQVSGASGFSLKVAGDDSAQVTVATGNTLQFTGANGISTAATEPDTMTISLSQTLTNIESISSASSNANLTLISNGTGDVVINDTLTFSGAASTPSATAVTKLYNKTAGGGGTGLFFINSNISSGTEGELISKKKATALAIALG